MHLALLSFAGSLVQLSFASIFFSSAPSLLLSTLSLAQICTQPCLAQLWNQQCLILHTAAEVTCLNYIQSIGDCTEPLKYSPQLCIQTCSLQLCILPHSAQLYTQYFSATHHAFLALYSVLLRFAPKLACLCTQYL